MLTKLFICPYFGDLPPWFPEYAEHIKHLEDHGYKFLILTHLGDFQARVKERLDIDCPVVPGQGKVWDYRPALGYLYQDEISSFDFWGHTDFDCVYGNVSKWVSDDFLSELDVHSNHNTYVCGPWTLYRNTSATRRLFRSHPDWRGYLDKPAITAWAETEFSRLLENSGLRYKYTYWQNRDPNDDSAIVFRDGALYDHGTEIMMHHFRRTKRWPLTRTQ